MVHARSPRLTAPLTLTAQTTWSSYPDRTASLPSCAHVVGQSNSTGCMGTAKAGGCEKGSGRPGLCQLRLHQMASMWPVQRRPPPLLMRPLRCLPPAGTRQPGTPHRLGLLTSYDIVGCSGGGSAECGGCEWGQRGAGGEARWLSNTRVFQQSPCCIQRLHERRHLRGRWRLLPTVSRPCTSAPPSANVCVSSCSTPRTCASTCQARQARQLQGWGRPRAGPKSREPAHAKLLPLSSCTAFDGLMKLIRERGACTEAVAPTTLTG